MLARLSRAYFYRHPSQVLLALVGIAAGIAVVTGVALLRGTLLESLDAVSSELVGERALVIRHPSGRLPVQRFAELARTPGAPDLVPVIRVDVRAGDTQLEIVGVDPFGAVRSVAGTEGTGLATALFEPTASGAPAVLSASTLELLGVAVGETLELEYRGRPLTIEVTAGLRGRPGLDRRVLMDISEAQALIGADGWVSQLLAPGDASGWVRDRIGDDLLVTTASSQRASAKNLTAGMRANLTAMSLLALATGLFVVYSVLSFLMVQRRRTFGMLRALGMTHRTLARMLVGEVLVIAAVGGLLGLVVGTIMSDQLLRLIASPVAEVYGQLAPASTRPTPLLYAGIWLAGLAAAVVVTLPVLREALAIPPGRIVRSRGVRHLPARKLVPLSALLVIAGVSWIALDPRLVAALGGLFLVLAGLIVLIPMVGFALVRATAAGLGSNLAGRALRLLETARGRLSPALAALSLALALAVGMGMMILGFRDAVGDWVTKLLRADVYVSVEGRALAPGEVDRIGRMDVVRALSSVRRVTLEDGTAMTAYAIEREAWEGFELLDGNPDRAWPAFRDGEGVMLSEPLAQRRRLEAGDRIELVSPSGPVELPVVAVFRDYSSEQGFVAASGSLYRRWFDDRTVDNLGVYLDDGVDAEAFGRQVQQMFADESVDWITPAGVRRQSLAVFDRTFRISWALATLVGLIALVALTSALLAQGLERSREHATLRALGLPPGGLFGLVTVQSAGLTLIALITALPLALLIHYTLSLLIQPRAFGWSVPAGWPPLEPVLLVAPVALVLGTLTGLYPAWRIGRRPMVEHLRADR
ncbi:MAG: ABC transporter permease [Candidatus Wenzhouxiangella sp. M2_3B_020]